MIFLRIFICLLVVLFSSTITYSAGLPPIKKLKALHLTTSLVEKGTARSVIIAPAGGRYRAEVAQLNERIRSLTGTTLPVFTDDKLPEEILRSSNVITLGNMATNAFVDKLYRQWQVILDLKYPGEGGFVVRSLHNPFATGHNVIFLGGSDDAGVSAAVTAFSNGLKGDATLKVGRLAQTRLGKGVVLPRISPDMKTWDVQSWNDCRRTTSTGKDTGYPAATFFGWNPISIAGALFYMTGQKEYLDCFKALALPAAGHVPPAIQGSDAFTDPANPLVKNSHYRAHLIDLVYDLIEESPLFTENERLRITNKLMEHQSDLDPDSSYSKPLGDRHATWHMLCIYTGSRYFSRYYPDPLWERRLANVRQGFAAFNSDTTWGGQEDTLNWVSTFIEPLYEFALLDGSADFVTSGAARSYMQGLETLMSGEESDDYTHFLPANLLFKAARLLDDPRYSWMAARLGDDNTKFRIGQSYWPVDAVGRPPLDQIGRVSVTPLSRVDRETTNTPVPLDQAFQLLSYRTGLEKNDDFLLLDGFGGTGRHPFQLNTLLRLRMFNGKNILSGYGNDLNVWRNGAAEPHVARAAALKGQLTTGELAYIHTEVPDMPGSHWERRILSLKGLFAVVLDRVVAREAGSFDLLSSWELGSGAKQGGKPSRRVVAGNGAVLTSADLPYEHISPTIVQSRVSRELGTDESLNLATLFSNDSNPRAISPLRQGGYLISGSQPAFVGSGPLAYPGFSVKASFCYLDTNRLLLEEATELVVQGRVVFSADRPLTLLWNLRDGTVQFVASHAVQAHLNGGVIVIAAGQHRQESSPPPAELAGQVRALLGGLDREIVEPRSDKVLKSTTTGWQPLWEQAFKGRISALAQAGAGIWAVSQEKQTASIARITPDGRVAHSLQQPGEILTIRPASGAKQSQAFSLLAGFKDDMLRAYSEQGKELWSVKAQVHPVFLIGDHYDSPWFTNPGPPNNMTGIHALLVGDFRGAGSQEIAVGRPSTVEFRGLDGKFLASAPTRWGTNTALAAVRNGAAAGNGPLLLAGKGYAGNPTLSGINGQYRNVSDGLYAAILPGYTNMHSWLMRGLAGLRVADLDGDGRQEVVYTLSGHWNELRVYDTDGKPLWMKFLGPDKNGGAPFMTALELADLTGDGRKAVIVGTRLGRLTAYDHSGKQMWQRRFDSPISSLAVADTGGRVVVGCDDGLLTLLDGNGQQLAAGRMDGAVKALVFAVDGVYAGSGKGAVRRYGVPK